MPDGLISQLISEGKIPLSLLDLRIQCNCYYLSNCSTSNHEFQFKHSVLYFNMGRYGKIEVRPRINGHPVTEYNDTTRDSHSPLADVQVNSLIETVPNSNYEIELITHPGFHFPQNDSWDVLSFAIEVDGVKMVKTLNYAKHYEAFGEYREIVEGAESSSNGLRSVRKFKFQPYSGGEHNILKSMTKYRNTNCVRQYHYTTWKCAQIAPTWQYQG